MLELAGGKQSFECLGLFRHLMVDIMSMTVYGFHHGALRNLSLGIEDPLSMAVYDFPKRGVFVRFSPPLRESAALVNPFHSEALFLFGLGALSVKFLVGGGNSCAIPIKSWPRYSLASCVRESGCSTPGAVCQRKTLRITQPGDRRQNSRRRRTDVFVAATPQVPPQRRFP